MAEIREVLKFPDGLTPGQSKDGGLSQLLYDTAGNLVDHGVFHPDGPDGTADDDGPITWQGMAVGAIAVAAVAGLSYAGVRLKRRRQKRREGADPADQFETVDDDVTGVEFADLSASGLAEISAAIDVTLDDCQEMSSREAYERLAAILVAAAFIADPMRTLSNTRIVDDVDFPELNSMLPKLTTAQVADTVNRMLAERTVTLDEELSANFLAFFGGGGFVDDRYVPLERANAQAALRLPDAPL